MGYDGGRTMTRGATMVWMAWMGSSACAGATGWAALPADEQRAFERCRNVVTMRECPPVPGATEEGECVSASREAYASGADAAERRRWLATHGCSRTAGER